MAELEDTARCAIQLAPPEVIDWLLPTLDADLAYRRWLDTEGITFPGEPKRRCDTVAELVHRSGQGPPWALVLEVEARWRRTMLDRVLEYQARLMRRLRHGPRRRDRYLVAGAVIFLRGGKKQLSLRAYLPGTDVGLRCKIAVRSLERESAAATLAQIDQGQLGRSILVWVPLMAGGDDLTVAQEWVRLVKQEADAERQKEYAGLTLVFAGWKGCGAVWQPLLEEWNVERIALVEEWKAKARREGLEEGQRAGQLQTRRADLHRALQLRFKVAVPADLIQAIEQQTDLDVLARWFDAVLEQPTLEAVRAVVQIATAPLPDDHP